MGVVFEATHLKLGHRVAIKIVLPEVARRPQLAHRFEYEGRAAARLSGRHTARVSDVDETPEGLPFLVMEFLEGHSLRDELKRRGPLPVADAVRYVREACEGVEEAHRAGVIHRDLKPANLFLSVEGRRRVVKVLDFGIAKAAGPSEGGAQTATDAPLGTYKYMSPEQANSPRSVDARTDVWSLGVVLYQLLTGKAPFDGEGPLAVVYAIATQDLPPLRHVRPDAPAELVAVLERALCKNLAGRYASARAFSDDLAPFDLAPLSLSPGSQPSSTPPAGSERPVPPSGLAFTPAQGLTPGLLLESIESATTQVPPRPELGPSLDDAPNDSVITAGTKSHVIPITPGSPTARRPRGRPLWPLAGCFALALVGGGLVVLRDAQVRVEASSLTPAARSERVPRTEPVGSAIAPTIAPAEPNLAVGDAPPLASASPAAPVERAVTLRGPTPASAARGANPSVGAPNARPSAGPRVGGRQTQPTPPAASAGAAPALPSANPALPYRPEVRLFD
jgi:eukaryotic-like serine/threonine-protein kinase